MRRLAVLLAPILLVPALLRAGPDDLPGASAIPEDEKPKKRVTCAGEVGFGDWCRISGWIQVPLRLENTTDEDLSLTVSTSVRYGEDGGPEAVFSRSVDLPSGGRKALALYVRPIQPFDRLEVQCRSARTGLFVCGTVIDPKPFVEPGRALLVTTGASALGGLRAHSPRDVAADLEPGGLPDRPEGYDGVDWAVLRGSPWASDPARLEAVTAWLESGGRVAFAGAEALRTLASTPLGRRLGLSVGEPARLEGFAALSRFAREDLDSPDGGEVLCDRLSCRGAEALVSEGGVPLVLRTTLGQGEVVLFAVDPEAFRKQPGYWGLWRSALDLPPFAREGPEAANASVQDPSPFWTADVLRGGLFHLERIRLDWIWWFLAAYLFVVAPLDYWLVRRLGRWRSAGLFTLAFWAVSASLVCYAMGTSGRFSRTVISRAGVIDAFPGENRATGRALASFYPNTNGVYDLGVPSGRGSAAVIVDPRDIFRSGLLRGETLRWEEGGGVLEAKGIEIYIGIQKILETRWRSDLASLGISAKRGRDGRWRVENHSKATLRGTAGILPPGGSLDLDSPGGTAGAGEARTSAQKVLEGWIGSGSLSRSPLGFKPSRPGPCLEFWMEGDALPLGIGLVRTRGADEGILLRLHLD